MIDVVYHSVVGVAAENLKDAEGGQLHGPAGLEGPDSPIALAIRGEQLHFQAI